MRRWRCSITSKCSITSGAVIPRSARSVRPHSNDAPWRRAWTLPSLRTPRTRPQGFGKPHRTRFPTAPTPIIVVYVEDRRSKRRTLINVSTESDQVHVATFVAVGDAVGQSFRCFREPARAGCKTQPDGQVLDSSNRRTDLHTATCRCASTSTARSAASGDCYNRAMKSVVHSAALFIGVLALGLVSVGAQGALSD